MKLIYLANVRLPTDMAHGIQIMNMCSALAAAGVETELVVPRRVNSIKADPFGYYGLERTFKITRLPCLDILAWRLGKLSFLVEYLSFALAAKIYLSAKKFDILYTRLEHPGKFFKNYILEVHTLPEKARQLDVKNWLKAKKIVVLTRYLKEELVKCGVAADKIIIAPDGVDLSRFAVNLKKEEARRKVDLPLNRKIILYSGSFCFNDWFNWKGVDVILEAAKLFGPEHLFVLVGGEEREVKLMEKKYHRENLRLISHQEQKVIPDYLRAADVLLLPNKKGSQNSEYHTSPLKLFEYLASGRPIVASDLPSLREVLNENNCLFFKVDSSADLAAKIKIALNDLELAERISRQAARDSLNYSWEKRAKKIIGFIK